MGYWKPPRQCSSCRHPLCWYPLSLEIMSVVKIWSVWWVWRWWWWWWWWWRWWWWWWWCQTCWCAHHWVGRTFSSTLVVLELNPSLKKNKMMKIIWIIIFAGHQSGAFKEPGPGKLTLHASQCPFPWTQPEKLDLETSIGGFRKAGGWNNISIILIMIHD